jgi:ketosteroid isomerase-like protein
MMAGAEQTRTERNRGVMSQENVETIRSLFWGVEERDLGAYIAAGHPEVMILEPGSLPYGGEYRGLEGMRRHAAGWMRTWAALQPGDERKLDAAFIDAGDDVVARWRLRARAPAGDEMLDMPMVGLYRLRDAKLVEAQMFYSDTAEVLRFLEVAR